MISDAVEYIRREVVNVPGLADEDVLTGNIHMLKKENNKKGLILSLANVKEERTLHNTSHITRKNNQVHYQEPPLYLNLYLLIAANFENYDTSLQRLSEVIEFFQSKRTFEAKNASQNNPFPATLNRLILDLYNLNFEQLSHLWDILGGEYLPSVLYQVRLVKIQRDESLAGPEISTIEVVTNLQ